MTDHPAQTEWLDVADVVALHQTIMARLGKSEQPFNASRLEGAVVRPRMMAYHEGISEPVVLGGQLAIGISQAQALLDGNKRTGYATLAVFLRANGVRLQIDWLDVAKRLEAIASAADRDVATTEFVDWLRGHANAGES